MYIIHLSNYCIYNKLSFNVFEQFFAQTTKLYVKFLNNYICLKYSNGKHDIS